MTISDQVHEIGLALWRLVEACREQIARDATGRGGGLSRDVRAQLERLDEIARSVPVGLPDRVEEIVGGALRQLDDEDATRQ